MRGKKRRNVAREKFGENRERKGRERQKVSLPSQNCLTEYSRAPGDEHQHQYFQGKNVIRNKMQIHSQTSQVAFAKTECSHANLTKQ